MSFLYASLLSIGLPLLAAPLVIHLINLRRRRRVEWAAMQFLLESQRRNRRWIVLKQLLLLALRTAAIGLVVLMLAGPVIRSGWAALFGAGVTHHLILLDDSYSMSDQWGDSSAFAEAKRAVLRTLQQARQRSDRQLVTIVRFSEAGDLMAGGASDFDRQPLDERTLATVERVLSRLEPSETDAGPVAALEAAARLAEPTPGETRIAYLVSDFRRPQWRDAIELRQLTARLRERTSKLMLVQCVDDERPNLAVTRLAPESGLRAAGIESWFEVAVTNYGDQPARNVAVALEQDDAPLPAVVIDEVPPGEETIRRWRATFPSAGPHQLVAQLERDAVAADNIRYFAAQVPASLPVLVIDGSARGDDGRIMRLALSPAGPRSSGWSPQVEPPSFLRRHEDLAAFAAIYLLDVPQLDAPEVSALEDYVRSGGGLAVFVGPRTLKAFANEQLYRDGAGLLPVPLDVPTQLLRGRDAAQPDIEPADHPLFRVFAGQRNSFLAITRVDFYYGVDPAWQIPKSGDVRVLARLRNGAPLVVEKSLGAGRVVLTLTKLSPEPTELGPWSDLAKNPAFLVIVNELTGYLSAQRRQGEERVVGEPLHLAVDEAAYLPEMRVGRLGGAESDRAVVTPAAIDGQFIVQAPGKPRSGVWEVQLTTREGKPESRYVAVNVPIGEGDLHLTTRDELDELLRGIDFDYAPASQFSDPVDRLEGTRMSDAVLFTLLAALVGEQLLAAAASYHVRSQRQVA